jgi:transcriptional regulator with XRE-family HTH domain
VNIGENIKRFRLEKGMTQEQLANIVGVSNQAVSKWECDGSIPDGLLFVPIADALGITTDNLFGRESSYEKDVYAKIIDLINKAPHENRIDKAREICWQTQKGLFGSGNEYKYRPDELKGETYSSYVTRGDGFTSISHGRDIPFFGVFSEPEEGFGVLEKHSEKFRELFEALGDEYVLKSFFAIYSKPYGYTFEKEVLARECGIPDDRIDGVMAKLSFAAKPKEIAINGETCVIYSANQRHELVAAFAVLAEFFYAVFDCHGYHLQGNGRNKPYFAK